MIFGNVLNVAGWDRMVDVEVSTSKGLGSDGGENVGGDRLLVLVVATSVVGELMGGSLFCNVTNVVDERGRR